MVFGIAEPAEDASRETINNIVETFERDSLGNIIGTSPIKPAPVQITDDIGVILTEGLSNELLTSDPRQKFARSLLRLIYSGKIRKLIKDQFRTFEEMLSGKTAYTETAFYKIEKFESISIIILTQ